MSEIEQLQSQLHRAQQDYEKLGGQMRELQDSQLAHPKPAQQQDSDRLEFLKRYGGDHRDNGVENRGGGFQGAGFQGAEIGRVPVDHVSLKKTRGAKESFDDFKVSDEQKQSVFDSLQGKLAHGEKLDERQQRILQLLSKDFGGQKIHAGEHVKNVLNRNGMGMEQVHHQDGMRMEHYQQQQQQQQQQPVDHDKVRLGGNKQQLPNPLEEGEEVKDLVEEQQKPGEFGNLGNDRKLEVVDREEEAVGAGGEELNQPKGGPEEDQNFLHEDDDHGKKANDREQDDNPLPNPIQDVENPDDEDNDNYGGAKKEKQDAADEENQASYSL